MFTSSFQDFHCPESEKMRKLWDDIMIGQAPSRQPAPGQCIITPDIIINTPTSPPPSLTYLPFPFGKYWADHPVRGQLVTVSFRVISSTEIIFSSQSTERLFIQTHTALSVGCHCVAGLCKTKMSCHCKPSLKRNSLLQLVWWWHAAVQEGAVGAGHQDQGPRHRGELQAGGGGCSRDQKRRDTLPSSLYFYWPHNKVGFCPVFEWSN